MSNDKLREKMEASPSETADVERRELFEQYWSAYEDLTEAEEETIQILNDIIEDDFTSDSEQFKLSELLEGISAQNDEENQVAERFFELFNEWSNGLDDIMEDDLEIDFDTVGEATTEANMAELTPGKTVVFNQGEYSGLTGDIIRVGVGSNRDLISVGIHQKPFENKVIFVSPNKVKLPDFDLDGVEEV
jgi:hypothetical protein